MSPRAIIYVYVPAGVFIVYANSTRKYRVWSKWRRGTRTSSLSSAVHPHFINRGREEVMLYFVLNIDITSRCFALFASSISSIFCASDMYFLLALGYCIFSYQPRLREYYSMNTSGWKGSHSIFDIVFALIYLKSSFLVEHYPLVHSG